MLHFRQFNYFLITIISSGLTYHYLNNISQKYILNLKDQIDKLSEQNKSLREELHIDGDIKKIIENLDDCLTILMKNIMDLNVNTLDEDLNYENKKYM